MANPVTTARGSSRLNRGQWRTCSTTAIRALDSLPDLGCLTVDPSDKPLGGIFWRRALAHVDVAEQSVQIIKQGIFCARPSVHPGLTGWGGLVFDQGQQLWDQFGCRRNHWRFVPGMGPGGNISIPLALSDNAVSQILIDLNQYKWMLAPKANAIVCFDDGGTPASPADDKWKLYASGTGGNLPAGSPLHRPTAMILFGWVRRTVLA